MTLRTTTQGMPHAWGNSYIRRTIAAMYSKDGCLHEGNFHYNNVLCSRPKLQGYMDKHANNQRFEPWHLLPVLPVLGNTNVCSTSMVST
jgi:hypothetical protein